MVGSFHPLSEEDWEEGTYTPTPVQKSILDSMPCQVTPSRVIISLVSDDESSSEIEASNSREQKLEYAKVSRPPFPGESGDKESRSSKRKLDTSSNESTNKRPRLQKAMPFEDQEKKKLLEKQKRKLAKLACLPDPEVIPIPRWDSFTTQHALSM